MVTPRPPTPLPSKSGVDRIPVTLLTGFLGAGKTTLLNHLIKQPDMAGAAVLINEFGEVGIDHHLVDKVDESLMILDSGCVCCSMQGDLVKALKDLHGRSSRREIPPITRVLIETTGLADPVPVIYTLLEHSYVMARFVCDGVVTAVDSTHGLQQLATHQEAVRQVAMADRLLLTKADLTDTRARTALEARLTELNPGATRIEVRQGHVSPADLFGGGLYTAAGKLPDVAAWLGEEAARAQPAPSAPGTPTTWSRKRTPAPVTHSAPERHDASVRSFVVGFDQPVPWYGFAATMGSILQAHGPHLLRVKGLMNIAGSEDKPLVIHCVQNVAYPTLRLATWPAQSEFQDHRGRLVFIVRALPDTQEQAIREALANLPSHPAAARLVAASPWLPTKCWLTQPMPGAGAAGIKVDGWVVHAKRFKKT